MARRQRKRPFHPRASQCNARVRAPLRTPTHHWSSAEGDSIAWSIKPPPGQTTSYTSRPQGGTKATRRGALHETRPLHPGVCFLPMRHQKHDTAARGERSCSHLEARTCACSESTPIESACAWDRDLPDRDRVRVRVPSPETTTDLCLSHVAGPWYLVTANTYSLRTA